MTAAERSCVGDLHNHHRDESGACDPGSTTLTGGFDDDQRGILGQVYEALQGVNRSRGR